MPGARHSSVSVTGAIAFVFANALKPRLSARTTAERAPQLKPAADGVFDFFKQKPVVALGDFHRLAQEEVFYSALVRDPRFADQVGNVVVEFGGSIAQDIIDR